MAELIKATYSNIRHPAGYSGISKISKALKIPRKVVEAELHKSDTFTLHYPARKKIATNKTQATWIDSDHQTDLCVLLDLAHHNDNFAYILVVIDVLSRFAWCEPLRKKSAQHVVEAYRRILVRDRRIPFRLWSDEGKEYLNREFACLLKEFEIEHRIPKNHDIKCGIAENFNRRLKAKFYRYFSEKNTFRWIDVLQDAVAAINESPLKSIGDIAPVDVNRDNAEKVWHTLYDSEKCKIARHKFQVGDKVRLAKKSLFRKGYKNTFTVETFIIKKLLFKDPPAYIIEDWQKRELDSIVYEPELVKYSADEFKIQEIVKTRRKRGKTEYLVRWVGYGSEFDSWIGGNQIKQL